MFIRMTELSPPWPSASEAAYPEEALVRTLRRIYRARMTTTSGGNLSLRDHAGSIWITPSAEDKGRIEAADVVRVEADGTLVGRHAPSSELPFHRAVYDARPDVRAVLHAHPVALVAFSLAGRIPPTAVVPDVRAVCGEVGWAPYALPGSDALGDSVAAVFRSGRDVALLENHGVVVAGRTLAQAFARFETLERAAQSVLLAQALGPVRPLDQAALALAHHERLPESALGGDDDPAARDELCRFVHRACTQGLVGSTTGSLSLRLDERRFLITPAHRDRGGLSPEDLVLVDAGRVAPGLTPSRAAAVHAAIYGRHPGVRSIVNATPIAATAFAITDHPFVSHTIPESFVCLRQVQRVPFGVPYQDPTAVAARLSLEQPTALLENDGVLVLGRSLLEAFDRLEVMETTAAAHLEALRLGDVRLLPTAVTRELHERFVRSQPA